MNVLENLLSCEQLLFRLGVEIVCKEFCGWGWGQKLILVVRLGSYVVGEVQEFTVNV